jgi:hypothetical protein
LYIRHDRLRQHDMSGERKTALRRFRKTPRFYPLSNHREVMLPLCGRTWLASSSSMLPAYGYRSMTWSSRWTRTICGNYGAVLLSYYPFWVLTILPRFTFICNVSGRVCGVAFGQQLNMYSRDLRRLKKHYFYKYKTETAGLQRIYVMGFTLTGNARRKLAVQVCRREGSVTCLRDERNMGSTAYIYPLTVWLTSVIYAVWPLARWFGEESGISLRLWPCLFRTTLLLALIIH